MRERADRWRGRPAGNATWHYALDCTGLFSDFYIYMGVSGSGGGREEESGGSRGRRNRKLNWVESANKAEALIYRSASIRGDYRCCKDLMDSSSFSSGSSYPLFLFVSLPLFLLFYLIGHLIAGKQEGWGKEEGSLSLLYLVNARSAAI